MKTDEIEFDNIDDDDISSSEFESETETDKGKSSLYKLDARRKLEDYLEEKRLQKELYDY